MPDVQAKMQDGAMIQGRIVLLLLFCHCLIVGMTVMFRAEMLPVLSACVLSFVLLLTIPYNLQVLETALARLAHGLPIEPFSLRWCWPLKHLFMLVNMLSQQTDQRVQVEQRNVAYRDQLLQQTSKTAAQEERNRLARDLHDSIKQQIFSIVVSAAAIKARWEHNPASARKVVDDIERTALEAQVEMQALLQQLRPTALENVGLSESLRVQCQALAYRTGAEVSAELDDLPADELLPIGAQEMIFRVVQEGFANIARHARASHVWLSLRQQNDTLLIEIGDDGQGFDLAKEHEGPNAYGGMGLTNIRERVHGLRGRITVWSMPNKGTTLHVCIPLVVASEEVENQKSGTSYAATRAQLVLRAGTWVAELAAAFILLYTPLSIAIWVVGICILLGSVAWLWAQQYRFQVTIDFGRKHAEAVRLLAQSYSLLAGILLLCMLYFNYFTSGIGQAATISSEYHSNQWWWVTPTFFGLFIVAIIVSYVRALQNEESYCKALAYKDLREHIKYKTQQVILDWLVWVGMIGLTVLYFYLFVYERVTSAWVGTSLQPYSVPATLQSQPGIYIGSILLFVWLLTIIVKSVRVARWQHALSLLSEQVLQDQQGGI